MGKGRNEHLMRRLNSANKEVKSQLDRLMPKPKPQWSDISNAVAAQIMADEESKNVGPFELRWRGDGRHIVTVRFKNGHTVTIHEYDGWLYIRADSTLTVRPISDTTIYVRPVGYVGAWVPDERREG